MTPRRIALIVGLPLLLGAGYLSYSHPEVFAPPHSHASPALPGSHAEADAPPALTPSEVKAKLDRGEPVILADVRGQKAYDAKHIAGAVSMPTTEIKTWGPKLKPDELVVFYCS